LTFGNGNIRSTHRASVAPLLEIVRVDRLLNAVIILQLLALKEQEKGKNKKKGKERKEKRKDRPLSVELKRDCCFRGGFALKSCCG
jgi:hypothetical protein